MSDLLQIYVDVDKQKTTLKKLDNGVYQLINRTGSFTVSIKEYEEELKKIDKQKDYDDKVQELKKQYSDVVWMYQLAGNNLPQYTDKDSFNEAKGIGVNFEWNPNINELEVGGGFVYIQPYRKGKVPEVNLTNGAIFLSYGNPEIKGGMWFKDKEGKTPVSNDQIIAFGSTVYLLVYTKDLYGQMLGIQFKDDDSMLGENEENNSDDDLGIYPESGSRLKYELKSDIPATIQKDTRIERQVRAVELHKKPSAAVTGMLVVQDADKYDMIKSEKESIQGAFFPVFIDPFWSTEANDWLEGSEIEIFPTIFNGNINSPIVLKTATLKVSSKGEKLNLELEQSNKPVLVGEAEANPADFYHCRYNTIKLSEKGKAPIAVFDSKNPQLRRNNPIIIDVIAGEKSSYYLDIDFQTEECEKPQKHSDSEIVLTAIPDEYLAEVVSGGRVDNNVEKEDKKLYKSESSTKTTMSGGSSTNKDKDKKRDETGKITIRKNQLEFDAFYYYDIPYNTEADTWAIYDKALQYFWLPDLGNKIKHITLNASSCAYDKKLDIAIYPDIKWTLKFGFNVTKDDVEALNKKGLKTPLGVFEALEDDREKWQEAADKKNKEYLDENNHLKKIRNKEINETRKEFKLKKKTKKSKKDIVPAAKGKIVGLINILKRLNISLAEEHYGGNQKNELNEEFVKQFYNRYQAQFELILEAAEIIEGTKDAKPFSSDQEKSVEGLMNKLRRKPTEYEILYPKIALVASWFYEKIDEKQYPLLVGRQGLGLDINLSAKPLIGITIKWDLLELLCRRHPIAYAVLKAVDSLIYILADNESGVECNFSVTGQIDTEIDWQYNMLAGFKDLLAKGKSALQAKIELKINIANTYKVLNYEVIVKRGFSVGASSGIGITDVFGVDNKGFYNQKILDFEGIKFEFSATGIIQVKKEDEGNVKNPLIDIGGEINGEITFLNYTFEAPKLYLNF